MILDDNNIKHAVHNREATALEGYQLPTESPTYICNDKEECSTSVSGAPKMDRTLSSSQAAGVTVANGNKKSLHVVIACHTVEVNGYLTIRIENRRRRMIQTT